MTSPTRRRAEESLLAAQHHYAYARWLAMSPLERLRSKPEIVAEPALQRIDQRGVGVLLGALPDQIRQDLVSGALRLRCTSELMAANDQPLTLTQRWVDLIEIWAHNLSLGMKKRRPSKTDLLRSLSQNSGHQTMKTPLLVYDAPAKTKGAWIPILTETKDHTVKKIGLQAPIVNSSTHERKGEERKASEDGKGQCSFEKGWWVYGPSKHKQPDLTSYPCRLLSDCTCIT